MKRWQSYKYALSNATYDANGDGIVSGLKGRKIDTLLEVGCYPGHAIERYKKHLSIMRMYGVDYAEELLERSRDIGVDARVCDLEKDHLCFEDNFFDVVVANQVFEHLKNIFTPISEIHRTLKVGGLFVISVPNLASFHSRVLLLFGKSPTQIRLWESHVRGFTHHELLPFLLHNGLFEVMKIAHSGFYPLFPCSISNWLSEIFPEASVYLTYFLTKTERNGQNWEDAIRAREKASNFLPS